MLTRSVLAAAFLLVLVTGASRAQLTYYYWGTDRMTASEVVPPSDADVNGGGVHFEVLEKLEAASCSFTGEVMELKFFVGGDILLLENPRVRIHHGDVGENGELIVEYPAEWNPSGVEVTLPVELCPALNAELVHALVVSDEYPDGAIRGQLRPQVPSPTETTSWGSVKALHR